jgi:hypothetical protein
MSRYGDGAIDQRGENSFRLRWRADGKRYTKTVCGSITDAKRELHKLLRSADTGTHVAPAKLTIADDVTTWLDNSRDLSPKTPYSAIANWPPSRLSRTWEPSRCRLCGRPRSRLGTRP